MKTLLMLLLFSLPVLAFDSLATTPDPPVQGDSITLRLYRLEHCCCSQYLNKTVSIQDKTIYLNYEVNSDPCKLCMCILPGNWISFDLSSLTSGKYTVYRVETTYCKPSKICPLGALIPVRIGEIEVLPTSGTEVQVNSPLSPVSVYPNPFTSKVIISLNRVNPVSITVHNINGRLVDDLTDRAGAEEKTVGWNAGNLPKGIYVLKIKGQDRAYSQKLLLK